MTVCGPEGVAHLRPVDRDLRDPVAAELVADVLVLAAAAPVGAGADGRARGSVRRSSPGRLAFAGWRSMPGCRAPRRRAPAPDRARRACSTRDCWTRRQRAVAARWPRAGVRPGTRVAIVLPAGCATSPSRCTRACCSARSPCRSTCGCRRRSARAHAPACALVRRRAAGRPRGRRRAARARRTTSTRPRSSSTPRARRGAPKPVELTYGNWLWSALGSAVALGLDPRGALAVRAAALARRRPVDPPARGDRRARPRSCTSASTPTRVARGAARPAGPTLVSLVPTTLARLLDAGLREPARAALRRCSAAARSRPPLLRRAPPRRASRSRRPTG